MNNEERVWNGAEHESALYEQCCFQHYNGIVLG